MSTGYRPSVVGARSAIEQCNFRQTTAAVRRAQRSIPCPKARGREGDSAEIDAIKAITWVADATSARSSLRANYLSRSVFEHATLEYGSAGVPLGTIHLWASARDWAGFGLLILAVRRRVDSGFSLRAGSTTRPSPPLRRGRVRIRRRILDPARELRRPRAHRRPADSFMAVGSQGQYTIAMPSQDLVIVKIGWAYTANDDRVAAERVVREAIAALRSEE